MSSEALSKWAYARDPKVGKAKLRAVAMPESPTKHGKLVPFPYKDAKQTYLKDFSNKEINAAIEAAPIRRISLKGLHAIQHSVTVDRLEDYIAHPDIVPPGQRHPEHRGKVDVPIVVQYKRVRYVHDGHHRLTAKLLTGETHDDVRFANLDAKVRV
jgi:hypothetical protein